MLYARLWIWLCLALSGCAVRSSMDTTVGHSDLTRSILDVYGRIFWWTVVLFVVVQGALLYIVLRYRAKGTEAAIPEQVHGNLRLEVAWTIVPVFILLHIAIPTVGTIFKTQAPAAADALKVNATGKQWWFEFQYPDLGVVTANELHVPLHTEIDVRLQSDNVIHAFWVPQLAAKRDMIPGRLNHLKFRAERVGEFLAQCAEYCGDSHALMRFRVYVDTPEDFSRWVDGQKAKVDAAAAANTDGFATFQSAGCVACHTIDGTTAAAKIGPNLTHVGSRATIAAGLLPTDQASLKRWISDPPAVKPGAKMPKLNLTESQVDTLAAWLVTLK